jgi:hypothetical protein
MDNKSSAMVALSVTIGVIAILFACALLGTARNRDAQGTPKSVAEGVAVSVEPPEPVAKSNLSKLDDRLAQIVVAFRARDQVTLASLAGVPDIDLKNNSARVILEMEISPDARPAGTPSTEIVTLPDGRSVQIQHAPAVAIRRDLEQAIIATGAKYETAFQNSVQVLAPFASLVALTEIPGVRLVRLAHSAQP